MARTRKQREKSYTSLITAVMIVLILCACGPVRNPAGEKKAAYTFRVEDTEGKPVAGVKLQVCSESVCQVITTDETGTAIYEGAPGKYEVRVQELPEGYFDPVNEVYMTDDSPKEKTFVMQMDEASTEAADTALQSGEDAINDITESLPGDRLRFSGTDLSGNPIDDSIFAEYDVTLINLWEPWCPPCLKEMPEFEAYYETCRKAGIRFNIIGFYTTEEGVREKTEELGISYPIVKDENFFADYQTGYVPTNFFADSSGRVLPVTAEEMIPLYQQLLEQYLEDYEHGERDVLTEANYAGLKKASENGELGEIAREQGAGLVYDKGQVNSLTGEMLARLAENRLP